MRSPESTVQRLLAGGIAGALATVPMSWAMELMHRALPARQQQPLPPREISERLGEVSGVGRKLSGNQRFWATLAAHLGYGGAMGMAYGILSKRPANSMREGTSLRSGIIWGLIVWAGSYLGLMPALGILTSATRHPARRSAVMIIAHLVFGSALGIFNDLLKQGSRGDNLQFLGSPSHQRGHPRERRHVSAE